MQEPRRDSRLFADFTPRRRRWPWMLLALVLVWVGWRIYGFVTYERPDAYLQKREEIVQTATRARLNDPASGEVELWAAYRALLTVSAAGDMTGGDLQVWLEQRAGVLAADAAIGSAADRAAAMRRQAALWPQATAARLTAEDLARRCAYTPPYMSCRVLRTGEVDGSNGAMRYQVVSRYDGNAGRPPAGEQDSVPQTEHDENAVQYDATRGESLQVYQREAEGTDWRLVLVKYASDSWTLTKAETPLGPIIEYTERPYGLRSHYGLVNGQWRRLRPGTLAEDIAALAPSGTCLANLPYVLDWPRRPFLLPTMRAFVAPNLPTMAYDHDFTFGKTVVARLHAVIGVEGETLVLKSATVEPVTSTPVWAVLRQDCGD